MATQTNPSRSALHQVAKDAFLHALKSVAPAQLVQSSVRLDESKTKLKIASPMGGGEEILDLTETPSILIIGAGKATQELVTGLLHVLKDCTVPQLKVEVRANYPKGQTRLEDFPALSSSTIELMEASHPISDECTVNATNKQIERLYACDPNTLAIVLMSGGGSALYETTSSFGGASPSKITLNDLQEANKVLIASGANIMEINTVRKHFSQVKGGRTAQHAMKSGRIKALVGLYLSDVVGNDLSSVASGPTCPDVSTFADCQYIIDKYGIREKLPKAIIDHLNEAKEETPKIDDEIFKKKVFNFLIGSADTSAQATAAYLEPKGFTTSIYSSRLDGEAAQYGHRLPQFILKKSHLLNPDPPMFTIDGRSTNSSEQQGKKKVALIATGEFTVTIKGSGVGGRNQEMLLAFMHQLAVDTSILSKFDFAVLSCAFDGIEGNSPATGAIVDSTSLARLSHTKLQSGASDSNNSDVAALLQSKLSNNDSFSVFGPMEDAIITGYTGTNVNDLTMILLQTKE